jgi:SPP1 family predicted phage head-tail adaptor
MQAGSLTQRVVIEQPGTARDDYGERPITWLPVATRWACITPLTGRELWNAQQVQPDVTHNVSLRYMRGITPKMRINYGGRILQILSVITVDENATELRLVCMERL